MLSYISAVIVPVSPSATPPSVYTYFCTFSKGVGVVVVVRDCRQLLEAQKCRYADS